MGPIFSQDDEKVFGCLAVLGLIFVPLGVWKAVEIVIWLCHHVHVSAS